MKYIAILNTDEKFFEDGSGKYLSGKYLHAIDANAKNKEWIYLLFNPLEQESVLDKTRAEMLEEMLSHSGTGEEVIQAYADGLKKGLGILDKYKAENEE